MKKHNHIPSLQIPTQTPSHQETVVPQTPITTFRITNFQLSSPRGEEQNRHHTSRHHKTNSESLISQEVRNLKIKNQILRNHVDKKVFWASVVDFGASLQHQDVHTFNKDRQLKLYEKLREEKKQKEERLRLIMENEERQRQQAIVIQKQEQEKKDREQKRRIEEEKMKKELAEKYKYDKRFSLFNIVNAIMLKQLHSRVGAFRLGRLIAKHYLNILNYKGIERRIKEIQHAPLLLNNNNILQMAQIKEIQKRLNEGIILRKKPTMTYKKYKAPVKAAEIFSPKVLKRVRFLQSCLKLKVFKTVKRTETKVKSDINRKTIKNRIKAQKKILDDIKFQNQSSPKSQNQSPILLVEKEKKSPMGLFSTLAKAATQMKNYQRVRSEKLIKRTNEQLVKQVQFLYYPIIRYVSVFYNNVVVWQISYQDITSDKTCIVLYFKGEGRFKYFYRLDIPIGGLEQLNASTESITVWPTVRDYLMNYLQMKGQLALLTEQSHPAPKNYKLSFVQGLSLRSRRRITPIDIEGIVNTKHLLNYLQTSQIVRMRKIFGSVYQLLPQFKQWEEDEYKLYIVNLPLIHNIILTLRHCSDEQLIQNHEEQLNQILCFRFVSKNPQFFKDQMLSTMYQLQEKNVYVQCAMINLQDLVDDLQISRYCLLSMNLSMNSQHNLNELLYDVQSNSVCQSTLNTPSFFEYTQGKWKFNFDLFRIIIEITVFEKDSNEQEQEFDEIKEKVTTLQEREFLPLKLSIENFISLSNALQETKKLYPNERCDFNILLRNILMESHTYNKLFDLVLQNAFTLDRKKNQVIIKQQYLHLLSKTHNFIQKMDHQSLYNKTDQVFRYSVFPSEDKYLNQQSSNNIELHSPSQFNKFFSPINQIEVKMSEDVKQIEINTDYMTENQDMLNNETIAKVYPNNFYFKCQECVFIRKSQNLKVVMKREIMQPIIIYTQNQKLIDSISNCLSMKPYQQRTILEGLKRNVPQETSFIRKRNSHYLINQIQKLPNYNLIKFMLISNSLTILDKLEFVFTLDLSNHQKCYAQVKVYYVQVGRHTKQDEKIYLFDGENLFLSLELYEYTSKLKKYIVLFNKYDLEGFFHIEKHFTEFMIYDWCKCIVANCKFDKRFLYTIAFSVMSPLNSTPQSPGRGFFRKINHQKCIFNHFQKYSFDQTQEKCFLNSMHKIYRVIAHYIEKFYLIDKKQLVPELLYKPSRFNTSVRIEYAIVSILAHTALDQFQIRYYFPRSKRQLMTTINVLQLQEMDFQNSIILDLIDFDDYNTYSDIEKYVHSQSRGQQLRKKVHLDHSSILQRIRLLKKDSSSAIDSPLAKSKPKKQGLAKLSAELINRNKMVRTMTNQNEEMSQKVLAFLNLSRQLNYFSQEFQRNRLIEIQIWKLLYSQVYQLQMFDEDSVQKGLLGKLIETFEEKENYIKKIIGKEFLMKKQFDPNTIALQNRLIDLYSKIIKSHNVQLTQPFSNKTPQYMLKNQVLLEHLCSIQFKIERLGSAYVECFLESQTHTPIFLPQPPIPYSNSFNYNIYFRYSCLNNYNFRDIRLNLRELLNLFIADGFFKSQTNYMNSKLSQSDILTMCHYLTYKIKTQNFLNLSQLSIQQQYHKRGSLQEHIILQSQDNQANESIDPGEGFVYTTIINNKQTILQLQLFQSLQKVILNSFTILRDHFDQKDLSYEQISKHYVPNFVQLIKGQLFKEALIRLSFATQKKVEERINQ